MSKRALHVEVQLFEGGRCRSFFKCQLGRPPMSVDILSRSEDARNWVCFTSRLATYLLVYCFFQVAHTSRVPSVGPDSLPESMLCHRVRMRMAFRPDGVSGGP